MFWILLNENCWYQYFSDHVREVKTWIDFELKINEVLKVLASFFVQIEKVSDQQGLSSKEIIFNKDVSLGQLFLTRENCHILELLKIFTSGHYAQREFMDDEFGIYYQMTEVDDDADFKFYLTGENIQFQHGSYKVRIDKIMLNLHQQLQEFIKIFNRYLELVIDKLEPKSCFKIEDVNWVQPDHIFSFNYTNTFQKFYISTSAEFLHGRFGEKQNIVLGVSDLEDESLRKLKAYGFTKYHQKLFKETDYLFLDDCSQIKKRILGSKASAMGKGTRFLIWGHSLDQSDQEYIQAIFKLNDERYNGVTVIVYYYNDNDKFMLLNNLLDILKKDTVEKWMKNGWLKFKKNPEIDFGNE